MEVYQNIQLSRRFVIEHPLPIELIVGPLSAVGYFARGIVESANSMHIVEMPLTLVFAASLIPEDPLTMSHILPFLTLVDASKSVSFTDILLLVVSPCAEVWAVEGRGRHFEIGRGCFWAM